MTETPETKPIRWSLHALRDLVDREIERGEAERTLLEPEIVIPGQLAISD